MFSSLSEWASSPILSRVQSYHSVSYIVAGVGCSYRYRSYNGHKSMYYLTVLILLETCINWPNHMSAVSRPERPGQRKGYSYCQDQIKCPLNVR